jgi:hypothetical protein
MRGAGSSWTRFALLAALLGPSGCSRPEGPRPINPTEEHLYKIGKAYTLAAHSLKRGPKSFAEIKPFLEAGLSDDVLRSPNDGEPFVIQWGPDYNRISPQGGDPYIVCAYEKRGVGGKRYVLRFPMGVVQMTDEELQKANFPPGFKPPT